MAIINVSFTQVNTDELCEFVNNTFSPGLYVPGEESVLVAKASDADKLIGSSFNLILFTSKRLFLINQKKLNYTAYPYKQLIDYGVSKTGLLSKKFILQFRDDTITFPKVDEFIQMVSPAIRAYQDADL